MTPPPQIEYKTLAAPPLETKSAPALTASVDAGTVEAYVAVTGVRDEVGDIIVPGAFSRTLKELRPKMCLGHDWNRPVGEPEEIIELLPGDPRLPSTTADGKPWPAAAGALYTRSRYMDTQDGRDARAQAQFYGPRTSYSIGYVARDARHGVDPVTSEPTRFLHDVDLYEYGPVLHGAHRLAHQKSVKSAADEELETKVRVVRDPDYWGLPIGTPIAPGMKPNGPKAQQRRERGQATPENLGVVDIEPEDAESEADAAPETVAPEAAEPSQDEPQASASPKPSARRDELIRNRVDTSTSRLRPAQIQPGMRMVLRDETGKSVWRTVASKRSGRHNRAYITDTEGREHPVAPNSYYQVHSQDIPADYVEQRKPPAPRAPKPAPAARAVPAAQTSRAGLSTPLATQIRDALASAPAGQGLWVKISDLDSLDPALDADLNVIWSRMVDNYKRQRSGAPAAPRQDPAELAEQDAADLTPEQRTQRAETLLALAEALDDLKLTEPGVDKDGYGSTADYTRAYAETLRVGQGAPDTEAPEDIPEDTAPDTSVPEIEEPAGQVPDPGAPEEDTPEDTAPEAEAVTEEEVPEELPEEEAPETEVAEEPYAPTGRTDAIGELTDEELAAELTKRPAPEVDTEEDGGPAEDSASSSAEWTREGDSYITTLPPGHQYEGQRATVSPDDNGEWRWSIGGGLGGLEDSSGYDTYATAEDAQRAALAPESADPDRAVGFGRPARRGVTVPASTGGSAPGEDQQMADDGQRLTGLTQSAEQALADGDALTLGAALRDLGAEALGEDPAELATQLIDDPEGGPGRLAEILSGASQRLIQRQDGQMAQGHAQSTDEELAEELEAMRGALAEMISEGKPESDFVFQLYSRRERSILNEQQRRSQTGAEGSSEDAPSLTDPAVTAELDAENQALLTEAADTVEGVEEAEDGRLEADEDVAERQERVASLLARSEGGGLDLSADSDQNLRATRADVIGEIRLQDYLTKRESQRRPEPPAATVAAEQDDTRLTEAEALEEAVPAAPKPRPGVAGAAEDLADALEDGDEERITTARARLTASLNRSRSTGTGVQALREFASDGDPAELRNLAEAIRIEARARRNEGARKRRQVRRFERERLRSLLGQIDAEMSRRGLKFDSLPDLEIAEDVPPEHAGANWIFTSESSWMGRQQTWNLQGAHYRATMRNNRYSTGNESAVEWEWQITGQDGEVVTSGKGQSADQETARAEVQADLSIQRALGVLAPDTVLPGDNEVPTGQTSARSNEAVQASVQAVSQRLSSPTGNRRNVLSGQRDPLSPPALRPPVVRAFPDVDAVRIHLTARAAGGVTGATGKLLDQFLARVQWDDVTLSPGGGLMVTKSADAGYVVTHTGTGALVRLFPSVGMTKSAAMKMASLMESLVDDNGNTVDFATDNPDTARDSISAWTQDGRSGISALADAVSRALLGEQLKNAQWNGNILKSIAVQPRNAGQTNPTRLNYIQSTVSGLASLIGNKPAPEDKHTMDIVRGAQSLYYTGAPDAAAVLLRRRAAELRSGETEGQGAPLLENLANAYLSSWAPQASPGERVLNLRPGERVAFADGPEEIRVYRAVGQPRSHAYGDGVITKVIDEQTGQRYELQAGGPSSTVTLHGEHDKRSNATLRYVPLGNPEYVVLDPAQQAPTTQEELTAAAWAELDSIPPAVLDAAAEIAPETRAERAERAAVTPRGVRAPRRRSTTAPRRNAPETAAPTPVAGEEKLAIGQARAHEQWMGAGLALADTALPGGFGSLAEAREYARARADELRGTREGQALSFVAGKFMENAILSPGGHFAVVPHNSTVVHLRSGMTVWGVGDTSWDVDGDKLSTSMAGQVANYMERAIFNGAPVDWNADLARIREQLKELMDQRLGQLSGLEVAASERQANPLVRIGRLAMADYMATAKNPAARDIAGFGYSASYAPQLWANPEAINKIDPRLESEKYAALGGRRSVHFGGPEYTSESKTGTNLARRVSAEIQAADALSRVAPLEAVRRLNRVAQEWDSQEIQPREGTAFRPSDYLRRLAAAITEAWDESKVSSYIRALRANFTGEMILKNFSVNPHGGVTPTDRLAAIRVKEQLSVSPNIRIFRDVQGRLHATFAGREVISGSGQPMGPGWGHIGFASDGSVSIKWIEKTGYSQGVNLDIPPDGWEFAAERPGADDGNDDNTERPGAESPEPNPEDEDAAPAEQDQRRPFPPDEEE